VIDGSLAARTDRIVPSGRTFAYVLWRGRHEIVVTQNDVRAIQLAKAALYAGVRLLMDKLGIAQVDRIKLAGAFGNYIDPKYAMVLGLIPDCDLAKVSAVGNAAGTGARMALLNKDYRAEIEDLPEDLIYEMTRIFHENLEAMAEDVAVLNWPATQGDDNLVQPLGDFPARTTMPFFCAVPPNLPTDPEGRGAFPGSGAYYVSEYRPGQRVKIRRNRHYGGKRPHYVDGFDVDLTAGALTTPISS
jgi:hypothetical protein